MKRPSRLRDKQGQKWANLMKLQSKIGQFVFFLHDVPATTTILILLPHLCGRLFACFMIIIMMIIIIILDFFFV